MSEARWASLCLPDSVFMYNIKSTAVLYETDPAEMDPKWWGKLLLSTGLAKEYLLVDKAENP